MSQAKLISDFTEWTGCTQQKAIEYLSYCNGNMDGALRLYFDNGGADLSNIINNIPTTTITEANSVENQQYLQHEQQQQQKKPPAYETHDSESNMVISQANDTLNNISYGGSNNQSGNRIQQNNNNNNNNNKTERTLNSTTDKSK